MKLEQLHTGSRNKLRQWAEKYIPTNYPCTKKRSEAIHMQTKMLTEALKLIPEIIYENERT